ncbi:MAG: alpha-D-ribose 1-methylphosphonate 5-triphosphate diphosphatase, partial [Brachymonas sp.]|nr:alpha-D-ribose 1-methylphosphonate 5-triphosphate diphosphatase [Brachymonas sp.]
MTQPHQKFAIAHAKVLLPQGFEPEAVVVVEDGKITDISANAGALPVVDAQGLWLLPGMVDVHGDAFERQFMPRPGVQFGLELALADNDRQLCSNGISTAYYGVTHSWEPGLRSTASTQAFVEALQRMRPHLRSDSKLHLRHETFHLDGEALILDYLRNGAIDLLAFNDHAMEVKKKLRQPLDAAVFLQRTGTSQQALESEVERILARKDAVPASLARLAATAVEHGVVILSHDDPDPQTHQYFHVLGSRICEFPLSRETAEAARSAGDAIVFGAPNIIRGGSHKST